MPTKEQLIDATASGRSKAPRKKWRWPEFACGGRKVKREKGLGEGARGEKERIFKIMSREVKLVGEEGKVERNGGCRLGCCQIASD